MSAATETFALPDVRCAGCVLKIERALAGMPGVSEARGNATQRRVRVVWDEAAQSVDSLRETIHGLGYAAERIAVATAPDRLAPLLRRLGLAGFGMMNIMAFSISVWFGGATDMGAGTAQFLHWLSAAVALPVAVYSGSVFHGPALRAIRHGRMTMDTPISIAIVVTFVASLIETARGAEHVYFDAVVSLIFFLLIGRVIEQMMHRRSGDAAANLRAFLTVQAERIGAGGALETVAAEALCPGDRVLVRAGTRVPADGFLRSAAAQLDESALTGEAQPRVAMDGQKIAAGSILLDGPVEIEVTQAGAETEIGQMARMAEDVASHKGRLQRLSDDFARSYIPLVLGGGALGFAIWYFLLGAGFGQSVLIAVAVLIVTCPCAAGLATPAVTSRAMNLALSAGVVVKSGAALERLGAVDAVFLDKTGSASLVRAELPDDAPEAVHVATKGLAAASSHPMARALVADERVRPAAHAVEVSGRGVMGADGSRLGHAAFCGAPESEKQSLWFRSGEGVFYPVRVREAARPGLEGFLSRMAAAKRPVTLMSGDTETAVERFAGSVGVDQWAAGQAPLDKLARVQESQDAGNCVMMVGDGINDSVALSRADVSASFGEATEIAQNAADVVLTGVEMSRLAGIMSMAAGARGLIRQNLVFSLVYNVVTVPLALAGFLTPAIAALLMSASSIVVMANGWRLRGIK